MKSRPVFVLRWLIGLVFLGAGAFKFVHPAEFHAELLTYEVPLPGLLLRLTAVTLPWLEMFCGGLFLTDQWAETVRPVVAGLCVVFVVMLGQAVARGLDLRCGCFGRIGPEWLERADVGLGRAVLLLAAATWLVGAQAGAQPEDA